MPPDPEAPITIDEYLSAFPPEVQAVLQEIRRTIHAAAPDASETVSYRVPAFRRNRVLVYFGAFKNHIGFYPPVRGDADLVQAVSAYAGEKGNLRFPLDQPMPLALVTRIVRHRSAQDGVNAPRRARKPG